MDRMQCKLKLESFNSIRNLTNLQYAVVFSKSPITGEVDQRHIFTQSGGELSLWIDSVVESCKKYNKPYAVYVNGSLEGSQGDLF